MAYVDPNYKTKAAFQQAVKDGVEHRPYNPSGMWPVKSDGVETIEGPHYPQPHRWYATVEIKDGIVRRFIK